MIARAVAFGMICALSVHGQDKNLTTVNKELESARQILEAYKDDDNKLRTTFKELAGEHKRGASLVVAKRNSKSQSDKNKLDREIDQCKNKCDALEKEVVAKQKELLARINASSGLAIQIIGKHQDDRMVDDLVKFTELFVFDPKPEVPSIHAVSSFLDQDSWKDAAKTLSKRGTASIPQLAKAFDTTQVASRYAVVVALGEIGPEVHKHDIKIAAKIGEMQAKTQQSKTLDRTERENRIKLLKTAIDRIQSK